MNDSLYESIDSVYDDGLAAVVEVVKSHMAETWDEGFDACAGWWEIHHHAGVRDEGNPYRKAGDDE